MADDEQAMASKFRRLIELREKRDEDKVTAEKSEKDYRKYEAELYDEIEEGPMKGSRRFDLGGTFGTVVFTPKETRFGRIIDADAAVKYFQGVSTDEEMLKQKISKGKLNEIVRERMEQGKPLPPGVDFYVNRNITISRKN